MNSTNRAANRAVILLAGLVLLALGLSAVALAALPSFAQAFDDQSPSVTSTVTGWLQATPYSSTGHSWLWLAAAAVLLVVIILFLVFIFRQGGGHTRTLLTQKQSGSADNAGAIVVDSSVAEQLLNDALNGRPELVSSHVSAYDVKGTAVLKVSVTCRRGVSPADARDLVERQLTALDALLGTTVPALVQVSGGFRARTSGSTRLA